MATPIGPTTPARGTLEDVVPFTFPVLTKQSSGVVNGIQTNVSSVSFADKILVTISQEGRLSQWIQVPLISTTPSGLDLSLPTLNDDMLPLAHLTPRTLLGGGGEQREMIGQLYATQIASAISTRNPEETRTLLVGLGLTNIDLAREAFFDMLELLQSVL